MTKELSMSSFVDKLDNKTSIDTDEIVGYSEERDTLKYLKAKDTYDNYHFDEEIRDDDVLFNYMIKPGKATSKNAIKLLSIMGFSEDIVDRAKLMADDFTANGVWR